MFQFNDKLKVSERVKAKCDRHPRYNPNARRGGHQGWMLDLLLALRLHQARLSLDAAYRELRE